MGREFLHVFEEWAEEYDQTVAGFDPEYEEVFRAYDDILTEVANKANGTVIEFGPGTGNLTIKLIKKGCSVLAIEPSLPMRKIAEEKIKSENVIFIDGDFFQYPTNFKIDTIVSTYAFHHLTDLEKEDAVKQYGALLHSGGKIVFADTMFVDSHALEEMIKEAKGKGFHQLAKDLQTEYYTTIPFLRRIFEENGFDVVMKQYNEFVWIIDAVKL